jgi:alcohol dehydrogenase class IV
MRTVKEIIDLLSMLNQDDKIWAIWVDKNELIDIINDTDYTDEKGNPIVLDKKLITNDFLSDVMSGIDNADYVWERFDEEIRDETRNKYEQVLAELDKAKDDTDLWDKE